MTTPQIPLSSPPSDPPALRELLITLDGPDVRGFRACAQACAETVGVRRYEVRVEGRLAVVADGRTLARLVAALSSLGYVVAEPTAPE